METLWQMWPLWTLLQGTPKHPTDPKIVGSWTYLSLTFGRVCVYLYVYVHEVLDETLLLGHGICLYKVVKVHRIIMKVVVQRHCISY